MYTDSLWTKDSKDTCELSTDTVLYVDIGATVVKGMIALMICSMGRGG